MIYSTLGTNEQIVSCIPLEGYILMQSKRPSNEHVSQEDGTWVIKFDKPKLEAGAYEVQNKYLDTNFLLLISQRMYLDNTDKPKTQTYVSFMNNLWTEYNIRKVNQTANYDFSMFAPETEYGYNEILEELNNG